MNRGEEKGCFPYIFAGIAFFVLLFVLCSCGSSRSLSKQEMSIESGSNHQRKDTASISKHVENTEVEETTEEVEEVTTIYDTDKPLDPVTGKHPIKSETKKNTKKEAGKKKDEKVIKSLSQATNEQSSAKRRENNTKEEVKQKEETTVPKQIGGVIWALVALAGVIFAGWVIYKVRKK